MFKQMSHSLLVVESSTKINIPKSLKRYAHTISTEIYSTNIFKTQPSYLLSNSSICLFSYAFFPPSPTFSIPLFSSIILILFLCWPTLFWFCVFPNILLILSESFLFFRSSLINRINHDAHGLLYFWFLFILDAWRKNPTISILLNS